LEGFLAFKQPGKTGLNAQLELIPFDTAKKNRIVRFLDTYSHNRQVGEADDDALVLAESSAVLRDLLSLMEQTDETHYKQMVELVTKSTSGEGAAS
ncbi:MAG TPA: hypothetical protein VFE45_11310, partial [Coriobacteriia bacterium]|nr:hypothetical protein [Coriobacteriia bacterium]